jgi:hypothetical protein
MTGAKLDIQILAGITLGPIELKFKDKNGDPVDLTGWSAWAQVRKTYLGAIIHDLSPSITDAEQGVVTISQTDEQTSSIDHIGAFQWDLILQNTSGQRLGPLVAGSCVINKPITQP